MNEMQSEQRAFESALSTLPIVPVPLGAIRRRLRNRERLTVSRRVAVLCAFTVVLALAFPFTDTHKGAVLAAGISIADRVRSAFFPSNPDKVIVLGKRTVVYDRVASVAEAQKRVPFTILTPSEMQWRTETVMVSKDATTPAVVLLFRAPKATWVKIAEHAVAVDVPGSTADVGTMLDRDTAPSQRGGTIRFRATPHVDSISRSSVIAGVRVTITASGPGATKAIRIPLHAFHPSK
jgi:hypothetical protein